VNKLSLLILILLFTSNCSVSEKRGLWGKEKSSVKEIKTIITKKIKEEREFNSMLEIKISNEKPNKNLSKNQNNISKTFYKGGIEKIGNYKFSKFDDFEFIDAQPVFYNEQVIFYNNDGTIILYDQNQKIIWKKNFYNKSEKKLKPRLNFAIYKNILLVVDNVAKYYAIDIETGDIIWSKNNIAPFNTEIKIKNNFFYVVDYKNILRSISIKDGSEFWNIKTEESLTKSNKKTSIVIKEENIYFINSIGDITAVNSKSGQLIWQLPTQSNSMNKNVFQILNSKLVISGNSILFSNNRNEFYSIDVKLGLINWKNEISSSLRPAVVGKFIITISDQGYLYIIDKKTGNIIRINDLHKNYKINKRKNIFTTGFLISQKKVYLTNDDGKLITADLDTGNIISINKISNDKILQPYINNNNLFLIKNGSIIRFN